MALSSGRSTMTQPIGASARPAGLTARMTSSGSLGASGGGTAVVPANPSGLLANPGLRERGRIREPAQMLPRPRETAAGPDGSRE